MSVLQTRSEAQEWVSSIYAQVGEIEGKMQSLPGYKGEAEKARKQIANLFETMESCVTPDVIKNLRLAIELEVGNLELDLALLDLSSGSFMKN